LTDIKQSIQYKREGAWSLTHKLLAWGGGVVLKIDEWGEGGVKGVGFFKCFEKLSHVFNGRLKT
jgi:hypothetical protein